MTLKVFTDEAHYRAVMKQTLDRVEKAFDSVDPDLVECSVQFGALTLLFPNRTKCILSAQPSVGQLWMALASRGVAFHFNFDPVRKVWLDDKGGGHELLSYLARFLKEMTGADFNF